MIPTPWGPIHFCADELRMLIWGLIGSFPALLIGWAWVRSKFKKAEKREVIMHHKCCHPLDTHDDHA